MNDEEVVTAFSIEKNETVKASINGYGYFGQMTLSEESKKNMLKSLADKLGITDDYKFATGTGDDYEKMVLTKRGKNADTTIQIISMIKSDAEHPKQYIVINISADSEITAEIELYQKVKRIYKEIGIEPQVSIEFEIEEKGDVISEGDKNAVERLFRETGAKEVKRIEENGVYIIYGYSSLVGSYLLLNDEKVNMQVVASYDESADKTYMKIGVPMVNSSY